jgi:hypothetical protein
MLDIKYGANVAIPGGPQFSLSNQVLQCEVYKDYSITLDATQNTEEITISQSESQFLNLLVVKATSALAKDSQSKLKYSIEEVSPTTGTGTGAGTTTVIWLDLDAPLFILGTWVNSILPKDKDKKISFKREPDPSGKPEFKKDTFQIEVLIGWSEAT